MWPVEIMKVFCELAQLNHAKNSKFALFGYEKNPCTSMNYDSHNGIFLCLPTYFIFIFKVGTNCHLHFCNNVFSFHVVFCRNNLPSFTSRKIHYCQALPKVVEIFSSAKIVGKICKNEIEHVLNHLFLKRIANNHIKTISTYVGEWNIPCCVDIRVLQWVSNVEKLHDLHCIVPKSDGSAFDS